MSEPRDRPSDVAMAPPDAVVLALTNAPDHDVGERIARALVDERLAACVNILAPCQSIYRWQGALEAATEVPLLIKTTRQRWAELVARLAALHPYEVPELIALTPAAILPAYSAWVIKETRDSLAKRPGEMP